MTCFSTQRFADFQADPGLSGLASARLQKKCRPGSIVAHYERGEVVGLERPLFYTNNVKTPVFFFFSFPGSLISNPHRRSCTLSHGRENCASGETGVFPTTKFIGPSSTQLFILIAGARLAISKSFLGLVAFWCTLIFRIVNYIVLWLHSPEI